MTERKNTKYDKRPALCEIREFSVPPDTSVFDSEKLIFEKFKFARDEVRFQHQLVNTRISSFLTSQSFLIAALIASHTAAKHYCSLLFISWIVLPVMGVVISHYMHIAIDAGLVRIHEQRELMKFHYPKLIKLFAKDEGDMAYLNGRLYSQSIAKSSDKHPCLKIVFDILEKLISPAE